MLGRETIQPVQLLLGIPQQCQEQLDPDSWVVKLADSLREVHQFARDNLRTSQARQKRDYDLRVVQHAYQEDDLGFVVQNRTEQ